MNEQKYNLGGGSTPLGCGNLRTTQMFLRHTPPTGLAPETLHHNKKTIFGELTPSKERAWGAPVPVMDPMKGAPSPCLI
jgi:hypothetical protein